MRATLTILGLYNYDNTIFEGLEVPEGLERETLIDYIFMECADLELLYPQLPIMKRLIKSWADVRAHSWERLYQSTIQKYNMIHNYDRYEDWADNGSTTTNGSKTANRNTTEHGTNSITSQTSANLYKAGYNNADMVMSEQSTGTNGGGGSTRNEGTDNTQESETATTANHQVRVGHLYGNIGVTTAAQMLTAERELYKWDVYQAIAQEFKQRFCIMVY